MTLTKLKAGPDITKFQDNKTTRGNQTESSCRAKVQAWLLVSKIISSSCGGSYAGVSSAYGWQSYAAFFFFRKAFLRVFIWFKNKLVITFHPGFCCLLIIAGHFIGLG
jgi:hypothetical protein